MQGPAPARPSHPSYTHAEGGGGEVVTYIARAAGAVRVPEANQGTRRACPPYGRRISDSDV